MPWIQLSTPITVILGRHPDSRPLHGARGIHPNVFGVRTDFSRKNSSGLTPKALAKCQRVKMVGLRSPSSRPLT
jgi:hypothetical protein